MNKRTRVIIKAGFFLLLLYVVALIFLYFFQHRLVFIGSIILSPEQRMAVYERNQHFEVEYEASDGTKLHGWFIDRDTKPLIVFYGGNGRDVASAVNLFENNTDCSFLTVNYRGYGKSAGVPRERDVVDDAVMILDSVLKQTGRDMSDVILIGESLGSGIATQVAARRPPRKLILLVPFSSIEELAGEMVPFFPVRWFIHQTFLSDQYASQVNCPVLILAAEDDRLVPVSHARKLAPCFPGKVDYREYSGIEHNHIMSDSRSLRDLWEECAKTIDIIQNGMSNDPSRDSQSKEAI